MSFSLDYQKSLNTCILDVHRKAGSHTDAHVSLALLDRYTCFFFLSYCLTVRLMKITATLVASSRCIEQHHCL